MVFGRGSTDQNSYAAKKRIFSDLHKEILEVFLKNMLVCDCIPTDQNNANCGVLVEQEILSHYGASGFMPLIT